MKKLIRNIVRSLLILAPFIPSEIWGQGQANNWYFGNNAGVTFNTMIPTALLNGALNTYEGCATLSDAAGNLLFYTDGIRVWTNTHVQMPNGFGLQGHPSAAQSAIIVPKPGSTTNYYVITVPENGAVGMRYSEVDMTLNGGLGDVLPGNKNTLLFAPSSEKVTAVKHANGLYYWVIGRENGSSNTYKAFLIDCNGVNPNAVTSTSGITSGENWGYLVASPDGSRLASASAYSGIELTDFNNATGAVTNAVFLGTLNYAGYNSGNYGVAFSPNSQVLYATSIHNWALVQWDLSAVNIPSTELLITYTGGSSANRPTYRGGALQLAPDGKIYVPDLYQPSLSAINNPDVVGLGCNFQSSVINLQGRNSQLGLPPFIQSYFNPNYGFNHTFACFGDSSYFSVTGSPSLDSVHWDFADPMPGISTSSQLSPGHVFSAPGTYNVRLIRYLDCVQDTIFGLVQIDPPPLHQQSINLCPGGSYTLPSGTVVSATGIYTDTLSGISFQGCDSIVVTTVTSTPVIVNAGNDTVICTGTPATLSATSSGNVMTYNWSPAGTLSDPSVANPVASPVQTTTYMITAQVRIGNNLVANGDFEQGNTGFQSGYIYTPPGSFSQGHYNITQTPVLFNSGFSNCGDHTFGNGNAMVIDAACGSNGIPGGTNIWCQTIAVTPNTDYEFSTWATNVALGNTFPVLQFFVNNAPVGTPANVNGALCAWNQYSAVWNSGPATSATICIIEQSGVCSGVDFLLDDISFVQLCTQTDTVVVRVSDPQAFFSDSVQVACFGDQTGSITVTPAGGISPFSYQWNNGQTDSLAQNLAAGMYQVQVIDSAGCVFTDSMLITEPPLLTANITGFSDVLCNGGNTGSATVTVAGGTPGYIYQWSPGGGTTNHAQGLSAGMHVITVTDTHQCVTTDSVMISELPPMTLTLSTPDDELCLGDQTTITATGTGGTGIYTYIWSGGLPGNAVNTVSPNVSTTYTVVCYDTNQCTDTATIYILVSPLPQLQFTATDVCLGNPAVFTNNSGVPSGSITGYTWDMGDMTAPIYASDPSHSYAASGTYQVSLSAVTDMGCTDTVTGTVTIYSLPVAAFTGDNLAGCADHCVIFTDQSTVAGSSVNGWGWWTGGNLFSTSPNPSHCFTSPGFHDVILVVTTVNGCSDTQTAPGYIEVFPLPVADFHASPTEIPLSDATVTITDASWNASSWLWNMGDGTSYPGQGGVHIYADTGWHCIDLWVASPEGCTDTQQKCVYVFDDLTVFIPNSFTPNNDQVNDVFFVAGRGIKELEMTIFDRWGEIIYYSRNKNVGWDGTYKGEPVKQDIYVYKVVVKDNGGNIQALTGQVNVIY